MDASRIKIVCNEVGVFRYLAILSSTSRARVPSSRFDGIDMEAYRLKVKVSEHEFDATGPIDAVQSQFAAFTALIVSVMKIEPPFAASVAQEPPNEHIPVSVEKVVMRLEGRMVSLTIRGRSLDDDTLLVLLGQKLLRNNDAVTGGEITTGLRLSGRVFRRVNYELDKMTMRGDLITMGTGRARRYRLTNQGLVKAHSLARSLAESPQKGVTRI
jgi:hypothetical protein